jgi:hypothetical protein
LFANQLLMTCISTIGCDPVKLPSPSCILLLPMYA